MPHDEIPTLSFAGTTYRFPFRGLLRPLTADEEKRLRQSITLYGVLDRVTVYDSEAWGPGCVIDGDNRLHFAAAIGVTDMPAPDCRADLDDETARELALSKNLDRRQCSPEDIAAARASRVGRELESRAGGMSLRAIAEEEGVSHEQVRQDIIAAGVKELTTDLPATVTGTDGKTYHATKPEPKPSAADRALAELVNDGGTEVAASLGVAILERAADPAAVAEALFAKIEATVERAKLVEMVRGWLARLEGTGC